MKRPLSREDCACCCQAPGVPPVQSYLNQVPHLKCPAHSGTVNLGWCTSVHPDPDSGATGILVYCGEDLLLDSPLCTGTELGYLSTSLFQVIKMKLRIDRCSFREKWFLCSGFLFHVVLLMSYYFLNSLGLLGCF